MIQKLRKKLKKKKQTKTTRNNLILKKFTSEYLCIRGDFLRNFSNIAPDSRSFVKALILGVVSSVVMISVLMCITAAILLISSQLPYDYLEYIMLITDAVSVFIGGYIAGRLNKSQGLILGLLCGAIVLVSIIIGGFITGPQTITLITLLKAVVIIIFSALGGIKGVNTKEKIHIK